MREWVTGVMTAAVLSALLELLAPEGKMRRYASFGIAAVLLVVLLSPLGALKEGVPPLPSPDLSVDGVQSEQAADGAVLPLAERALREHLADRFSLDPKVLRLSLSFSEDRKTLHLSLALPRGAPLEAIRAYLAENTSLECEVSFYED